MPDLEANPTADPAREEHAMLSRLLAIASEHCPGCGHMLWAPLAAARCPACNELLVLRLGLTEPVSRTLIAGAVPLAGALGFSGILSCYFLIVVVVHSAGPRGIPTWFLLSTAIGAVVSGSCLALWLSRRGRTWIRRREPVARGLLVALCWLVPAAVLVGFLMGFR